MSSPVFGQQPIPMVHRLFPSTVFLSTVYRLLRLWSIVFLSLLSSPVVFSVYRLLKSLVFLSIVCSLPPPLVGKTAT